MGAVAVESPLFASTMSTVQSLIAELDEVLLKASRTEFMSILQRMTDLFVERAPTYSNDHIAVFDEVFGRLVGKAERPELIELSDRLAPVDNAPTNVVDRLARHDDIAISGPLLLKSSAVKDQTLAAVAKEKSERHLSAIAGRDQIGESVTDVLVDRCSAEVACKVTGNKGATLSELGFVKLINRAKDDKALASAIGSRSDLPPELQPFLKLALS
jgi:uncharacterized protein (DUF2336 family)